MISRLLSGGGVRDSKHTRESAAAVENSGLSHIFVVSRVPDQTQGPESEA